MQLGAVAAALAGVRIIGIDIDLRALLVAKALAEELGVDPLPQFVLADARFLSFKDKVFDGLFSYSVLQHFSKENCKDALNAASKKVRPGGRVLVQMPNRAGLRSFTNRLARGFDEGKEFDVRYYSIQELSNLFATCIGETSWSVDCFLGLNVRSEDADLVQPAARGVIRIASILKSVSSKFPPLKGYADYVFLHSINS